jgi:hypothetical protein
VAEPVVVIGAGPHGLAAAAYLRAAGVTTRSFGVPLEWWRDHMPKGMLLRSRKRSSSIAAPYRALTIERYEQDENRQVHSPNLLLDEFIDYAMWFQRCAVPDLDERKVVSVNSLDGHFELTLDDGEQLTAARVVVAAGLAPFAYKPPQFSDLPPNLVSHAAEQTDLGIFASKRVAVIGGGQSALESAALLTEGGADVEVLMRAPAIRWLADAVPSEVPAPQPRSRLRISPPPTDVGGRLTGWIAAIPESYRRLPRGSQSWVMYRCVRPAGSGWLRPRLTSTRTSFGRFVVHAEPTGDQIRLRLDDDSERTVDHVLLGTGYAVDVTRYPFLAPEIIRRLRVERGYPKLRRGLESTVPGLHFVGAPAASSFGPIMRFVVGTWYAAPAVARSVAGIRQPPLSLSF